MAATRRATMRARFDGSRASVGGLSVGIWAALITVYILWGSTYLAIREGVRTMPPLLMASTRFLVAGGVLYAFAIKRGDVSGDRPKRRQWLATLIAGGLLLGANGGVSWSEQHIPSGIAALLVATVPLWMVVVGAVTLRNKVRLREVLGVLVGFGGVALLALLAHPSGAGHFNTTGIIVLILSSLSWASGSVYASRAPLPRRPLLSTAMQMLAGGVVLGIAGIASGEIGQVHPAHISLASWLGLAYLIVFGSWIGFSAYAWLLRNARISLVGTYAYVNPVIAVLLGWAFLSEPISGMTLLAGAVILLAVALIVSAQRLPAAPAPEPVTSGREGSAREVRT